MNQLLLFKSQRQKSLNQGFTTLEILVSIIIALAFVSVAMQSFVLAMGMKVEAQEKQRANQLIQEDLERTNILASNIAPDHDAKCFPAAYANGYAKELWDVVEPVGSTAPTVKLLKMADGTEAGKTLTLSRVPVSDTSSTAPHRTLKIDYRVTDPNLNVIAERYVEVIPDVALQCP
jgi:type II secretory pathway pseudopilin PulG